MAITLYGLAGAEADRRFSPFWAGYRRSSMAARDRLRSSNFGMSRSIGEG